MYTLLFVLLILLLVGALPAWPYARGWGYYPSGVLGTVLLIFLILLLLGYFPAQAALASGASWSAIAP